MTTIRPLLQAANRVRPGNGGFTLIELIISIVLLGILAAVGATMFSESFTITSMVNANQASTAQARYALERQEREIREVNFVGTAFDITEKTTTRFVFTKSNGVTVTIDNSGSNLTLGYSNPATTAKLTDRVASGGFTLTYCEANGTTCGNAVANSDIRFVQIVLAVTDATSGQTISQRSRIALRNAPS